MLHSRLNREKKTISAMIRLHCLKQHKGLIKNKSGFCRECEQLQKYAHNRVHQCRYGVNKPTCGQCVTPCYNPDMRHAVRSVMKSTRYRMLLYHPILTYCHLKDFMKARIELKNED